MFVCGLGCLAELFVLNIVGCFGCVAYVVCVCLNVCVISLIGLICAILLACLVWLLCFILWFDCLRVGLFCLALM